MAHIVKLIYVRDRRGTGIESDPLRTVPQLWTLDGNLVAEDDREKPDLRIANLEGNDLTPRSRVVGPA